MLQEVYPKGLIKLKERYFAWVQSLYIVNLLSSTGILKPGKNPTVAIIGSGLPFLEQELEKDKVTAISLDSNLNLARIVQREYSLRAPVLIQTNSLPLQDDAVNLTASHNYLQKLPSEANARAMVKEMLRVSTDYSVIQVTPKNHPLFKGDTTHSLGLTVSRWQELIESSAREYGDEWRLREVHNVRIADAIPIGRPPVFVLERGSHVQAERDISHLRRSTRAALAAEAEATIANLISASRPALAAYIFHEFEGIAQSISIGGVMALDALDGIVARKIGPSPLGKHIDRISDHAVAAICYFSLGYPVFGVVNTARDIVVDVAALKLDESRTHRRTTWSRYAYGIAKTATFMTAPISHAAGEMLALVSTGMSFYRAVDLIKGRRKR